MQTNIFIKRICHGLTKDRLQLVEGNAVADHFVDVNKMLEANTVKPIEFDGIKNCSILETLGLWEKLSNPDFKHLEFERFRTEAGSSYNPDFNYGEFAIIKSKAGLNSMRTILSDNNIKRLK